MRFSLRALVALLVVASAWLARAPRAAAQTMIPGGNIAIQTWTPAGSPYLIQGDITVIAGGSLTIQPGTVVRLATSDGVASGADTSRVEIIVNGTLNVSGTAAMPVTFAAQTGTSATAWYGIRATTGSTVSITGASIQNAFYGVRAEGGSPTVDASTLSNCQFGVYVLSGGAAVTGSIFTTDVEAYRVDSCSGICSVATSTFFGNTNAIRAFGGAIQVRDTIATNNSGYGAYASGGSVNITYSNFWTNTNGNVGATTGTGFFSINPLYAASSLRITSNSPCRFAASGGGDIGALPYAGDATPGLYGTLWTNTMVSAPTSVAGDLTVAPGVTLTLAAGATLTFATSDIMVGNADTSRAELRVQGTLVANGNAASPVTLTSTGSGATSWYGVVFVPGSTGSRLNGLVIEQAFYGLRVEGGVLAAADGMTIRNCQFGTYVLSGGIDVENTVYTSNVESFRVDGGTGSIVGNCTFYGNTNAVRAFGSSITVRNTIATNNSGYGAYASGGSVNITYSDFWANTNGNVGATTGTGFFSINPLYAGASLRLTSNSPCRFAGSGGGDIGALPYTGDATPGLYGTLWTNTMVSAPTSVAGDLTVAPGVTLTLAAGATLTFATSDIMVGNADTSRAELRVQGTLVVNGTSASPVTLTSAGTSATSWYGVVFVSGSTGSRLGGLVLEEAFYGLRVEGGVLAAADGMTIRNCQFGTYVLSGGIDVENTVYTSNVESFRVDGGTGSIVGNCTFYGNTNAVRAFGSSITVRNTIATNNSGYGAYASGGSVNITYSDFWTNTNGNVGATTGAGMISINPLYVSGSDLHLTATSSCIDAGTATGAPTRDHDGSPRPLDGDGVGGAAFDMGAYEYARTTVCGDGMLGAGEVCDDGALNGTYGHCNAGCSGPGPRCGDAMMNGPELCDDGNAIDTDACTSACLTARCGDGFQRAGVEECDDANTIATDGCTDTCHLAVCGDGVIRAGVEQCDDGNAVSTDACVSCASAFCGDGYVRAGTEECDDGNASNTDTCTNACHVAVCGDGIVGPGETCDDGNRVDTDTCTNRCVPAMCGDGIMQAGEECDDGNAVNTDACTTSCHVPRCGDGFVQTGEVCDDGNMVDTDTCTNSCQPARCGDSIVQSGETCDDGNTDPTDGCTSSCLPAACGDGFVHAGVEACDDGNTSDTDGCIAGCIVASCGDGHLHAGVEACDDGNTRDGDGCSSTCSLASCGNGTVDPGEECDDGNLSNLDACLGTCLSARCGDGFVRTGLEACDDGNALDNDACVSGCHLASCGDGFVQAGVEACDDGNGDQTDACLVTCASASCGDGFVESGVEECDDSNTTAGDGCSPTCTDEPPPSDAGVPDGGTGDAGATTPDAGMGGADAAMRDASMSPDGGTEAPTTSGGCGCRAAGGSSGGTSALGMALALTLWLTRRRTR